MNTGGNTSDRTGNESSLKISRGSLRRSTSTPELHADPCIGLDIIEQCILDGTGELFRLPRGPWRSAWWGWASGGRSIASASDDEEEWRTARKLRGMYKRQLSHFWKVYTPSTPVSELVAEESEENDDHRNSTFGQYVEKALIEEEELRISQQFRSLRSKFTINCVEITDDGIKFEQRLTKEDILYVAAESDVRLPSIFKAADKDPDLQVLSHYARFKFGTRPISRLSGLTKRDVRQVDPSFDAKPALWVRRNCILVSMDGIRALIFRNKILIFDPYKEGMKDIINIIHQKILQDPLENGSFYAAFEFRALEGILIMVQTQLERTFYEELNPKEVLDLEKTPSSEYLESVRQHNYKLTAFTRRSEQVLASLQELLENDEDMTEMYLTEKFDHPRRNRNILDHDEAEMLLEHYVQYVESLWRKADVLNSAVADSKGLGTIELAMTQNKLLLMTLYMSIVTVALTGGTAVANIFGMNLPYPGSQGRVDESMTLFYYVVGVNCTWVVFLLILLKFWCHKEGLHGAMLLLDWNQWRPKKVESPFQNDLESLVNGDDAHYGEEEGADNGLDQFDADAS